MQSSNTYGRKSQLGQINSPLHPLNNNNYHQMRGNKPQLLAPQFGPGAQFRGQVPTAAINNPEDYPAAGGQRPIKSKTSLDQYQNSAITPKQANLLDRMENIKRKGGGFGGAIGGSDDKNGKFPPLGQLQLPNIQQQQVHPFTNDRMDKNYNHANAGIFNQKGMINTFNLNYKYPNNNESTRNSYSSNNQYQKASYEYNKGNQLPRIDQGQNQLYQMGQNGLVHQVKGQQQQQYQQQDESMGDKRKKYQSYDINVHNSQLLSKMMDNGSHSQPPHKGVMQTMQQAQINAMMKPYQGTFSPMKKYGNASPLAPTLYSPEKHNNVLSQSNSFNNLQNTGGQDTNVSADHDFGGADGICVKTSANQMFRYSMKTKPGCTINKVTKTNQDSAIVNPKILADINITQFAVGDGHGLNGHLVSQLIKRNLPRNVLKFLKADDYSPENIKNAISRGFYSTNQELFNADFDTNLSGSTLISVFIHENKLYCANVGDSRAIIGKQKPNVPGFRAHPLSIDHKPSLERERQRIIKAGGRVDCQRDYGGNPLGPLRVWLATMDMPGLAMTRSMADKVGVQAGVISEPEFEEMEITEEDKFMVVASDGVWEYLSDQEVIKIVGQFYERGQYEQAAEKLIVESTNAWRRESLVRDDITCIVIFFNHHQKAGQKASSPYY